MRHPRSNADRNLWAASMVNTTTDAKKNTPGPGRHRHQGLELNQSYGNCIDEYVEHRPASYQKEQTIEPRAIQGPLHRAALDAHQQVRQRHHLPKRNHHARDQDHECQRQRSGFDTAVPPRAEMVSPSSLRRGRRVEHGQRIGRDIADRCGDDERPRVLGIEPRRIVELFPAAGTKARVARPGGA
jgi:hypothetical protein